LLDLAHLELLYSTYSPFDLCCSIGVTIMTQFDYMLILLKFKTQSVVILSTEQELQSQKVLLLIQSKLC